MSNKIWLSSPHMSDNDLEIDYINKAFDTNWIAPLGKNVDDFEKEICLYTGSKEAVALSSGTSAIHLGLKALGIKKGDKVACQSFTFSASANPILYEGATPIFVGSEEDTWNMSPALLERALKENNDIKVVIVVNLYGISAKLDEIRSICKKYDVKLLEDAAESLGTFYKGKSTGLYGDVGIFSFNGNKIITTSGGGMLVTHSKEIRDKVQFWATQSREPYLHYEHEEVGYNYRLSNILAGVGIGQMKVLNDRVKRKRRIHELYSEEFKDVEVIKVHTAGPDDYANYWLTCLVFSSSDLRDKVLSYLKTYSIESRPLWKPMHLQPIFEKYAYYGEDVEVELFENGLCIPSDTKLSDKEIKFVAKKIKEVCNDGSHI